MDRERVDLLRHLTQRHPSFVVWKNLDRALLGNGDVDAAAPLHDAATIAADAVRHAAELVRAEFAITCHHVADKHLTFFVQRHRLPQLLELDLCTQPSRGLAPWASPTRMEQLSVVGDEGIRRLRPGAQAVVSLVLDGISPAGTCRLSQDRKLTLAQSLSTDWPGAEWACRLLAPAPATRPLVRLAGSCATASWDRTAALVAFQGFVAAAPAHPVFALERLRFRYQLRRGAECVMSRLARLQGRQVPAEELDRLLGIARQQGHDVREL